MSLKKIITESIARKPLSIKESLEEELRSRIYTRLYESDSLEEAGAEHGVDTGPLMKANAWIKPAKIKDMIKELESEGESGKLAIGEVSAPGGKPRSVAILIGDSKVKFYFKKGKNVPHSFYYDTGNGHRRTKEKITITGTVDIKSGETKGTVDVNKRTSLMVYK